MWSAMMPASGKVTWESLNVVHLLQQHHDQRIVGIGLPEPTCMFCRPVGLTQHGIACPVGRAWRLRCRLNGPMRGTDAGRPCNGTAFEFPSGLLPTIPSRYADITAARQSSTTTKPEGVPGALGSQTVRASPCRTALFVLDARLTGADSFWFPFASSAPAAVFGRPPTEAAGLSSKRPAFERPCASLREDSRACLFPGRARDSSAMLSWPAAPRAIAAMGGPNIGANPVPLKLRVPSCGTAGRLSTLRRLNSSNLRRPASRNRCRFCSCSKWAESSITAKALPACQCSNAYIVRTECEQVLRSMSFAG